MGKEEKEKKKGKLGGFELGERIRLGPNLRAVTAVTMAIRQYGTDTYWVTSACNATGKRLGRRRNSFFDLTQFRQLFEQY